MDRFNFSFIGTGNAWPVMISEEHPFYNADMPGELSNAAYQLEKTGENGTGSKIIFDAGHGVIPFLIQHGNKIPAAVILTHPHLDHTVSLDWIAQSYFKKHQKKQKLPVYCSLRCFQVVVQSFPQLNDKLEFNELYPAQTTLIKEMEEISITCYPLFHGNPAVGAGMIRVDINHQKMILLTGDILCPVLRKKDYDELNDIPVMISDANNRFPYPSSNHWSITPNNPGNNSLSDYLVEYRKKLSPAEILSTHLLPFTDRKYLDYFDEWLGEFYHSETELSILDFCKRIKPKQTFLVHYGGGEDEKHYHQDRLNKTELESWAQSVANNYTVFKVPVSGDSISFP